MQTDTAQYTDTSDSINQLLLFLPTLLTIFKDKMQQSSKHSNKSKNICFDNKAKIDSRQPASSESSVQSEVPSHRQSCGMQWPVPQRNCPVVHSAREQSCIHQDKLGQTERTHVNGKVTVGEQQ